MIEKIRNVLILSGIIALSACATINPIVKIDFDFDSSLYLPHDKNILQLPLSPKEVASLLKTLLREERAENIIQETGYLFENTKDNKNCLEARNIVKSQVLNSFRANNIVQYRSIDRNGPFIDRGVTSDCAQLTITEPDKDTIFIQAHFYRNINFKSKIAIFIQPIENGSEVLITGRPEFKNGVSSGIGNSIGTNYLEDVTGRAEYYKVASLRTSLIELSEENWSKPNRPIINEDESDSLILKSSGSGFFISDQGYMITNFHVVDGCKKILVGNDNAKIISTDKVNDLAILQTNVTPKSYLNLSNETLNLSQKILVYGFPLSGILGANISVTDGIISSLSGIREDYSNFTISAPIQAGNSGGPVVNEKNEAVGVVVASLNNSYLKEVLGTESQNVNFGIRSSIVKNMLEANNIKFNQNLNEGNPALATILLSCMK